MNKSILEGRKVVEIGGMLAAPFATHILAQLGAEVIKIEPPKGDVTRKLVRGGPSGTFITYNRGKKSLCLDLSMPKAQVVLHKLLESADILVHNLAPAAARRLNLTFEVCHAIQAKLIYCHIRGYGAGPQADQLASNPAIEAATGVMHSHVINGRPARLGPSYHDQFAGSYAVIGILAELLGQKSHQSIQVEVGLFETGLHIAARDLVAAQLKKQLTGKAEGESSSEFNMPGYGSYETRDGRWIFLMMLTDEHWKKFSHTFCTTEDYGQSLATLRQRKKLRPQVEQFVEKTVKSLSFPELAAALDKISFGYSEVIKTAEVLDIPQAREHGKLSTFEFQGFNFEAPNFPVNGGHDADGPPPLLGEHSNEILKSLGYSDFEISNLIEIGITAVPDQSTPLWAPTRQT